jgi:hypothetical protein
MCPPLAKFCPFSVQADRYFSLPLVELDHLLNLLVMVFVRPQVGGSIPLASSTNSADDSPSLQFGRDRAGPALLSKGIEVDRADQGISADRDFLPDGYIISYFRFSWFLLPVQSRT